MRHKVEAVNLTGQAHLLCTRRQELLFNRGYLFAVVDHSGTVLSLHRTQGSAEQSAARENLLLEALDRGDTCST